MHVTTKMPDFKRTDYTEEGKLSIKVKPPLAPAPKKVAAPTPKKQKTEKEILEINGWKTVELRETDSMEAST